jgi:uncharacterized protein (TIGR03084 family)
VHRPEVYCQTIAGDLHSEQAALEDVVAHLSDEQWQLPTPSPGWTITDQIAHLTYFDFSAALAISNPTDFAGDVAVLWGAVTSGDSAVDELTLGPLRALPSAELLERWREGRRLLSTVAAKLTDTDRVDWYGPSMGARSFLTARLMETWAHGQDVGDALRLNRPGTDRLRHIARLGYITRGWSYSNRGLQPPAGEVRLTLAAPSGEIWTFGESDASEHISGEALDFCLVVNQRRHLDDTALECTQGAREWLLIAQAFAGPATNGPAVGTRL